MSTTTETPAIDMEKLMQFMIKIVGEMGAAATAPLVLLGDQLGLYKAIAEAGSVTSASLAQATDTHERYIREWLANQATGGYIDYDADTETYSMNLEQQLAFANEDSPVYVGGAFHSFVSLWADQQKLVEAFRTGEGVGWGNHHSCLFSGVAKFFKPSYKAHLVQDWIPALDSSVQGKLVQGGSIADVGCGYGTSTLIMAKAFPNCRIVGYDFHAPSIEKAREAAKAEGLSNVTFEVATAQDFPGGNYNLVTFFDCLHDMGDPAGAAKRVRGTLAPGGSWMIVEPASQDTLGENMNPISRLYYAYSTQVCTPSALSQDGGFSLGAQAGEARLSGIIGDAGFGTVRRATETPFNMILEARV